jgi:predicted ferric reductase
VSFIIRNLGDYTSKLNTLSVGQNVYVDGPYGSISLAESAKSKAIVLIAGGAGIAPMLSLLRGLAEKNDPRPVRLIYGNNRLDQMVLQDEIKALEQTMPDFRQQRVCAEAGGRDDVYQGVIDKDCIAQVISTAPVNDWTVYLCGPQAMIAGVNGSLKALNIPNTHIHYEQLSF